MNTLEFQQKISEAGKPVVIDFWAPWCGPCRMTKPILDKLAKEYADRVEFLPVNADDSREVLEQFKIFGIPTVLTLRAGKEAGRVTGAQNEVGYRALVESLAEDKSVSMPLAPFDRILRLGAGILLALVGISTGSWIVMGIGGIVAFTGYDRCPIWKALTGILKRA
jgi:thioredoxin 1